MVQCNALVSKAMEVYAHEISWVDAYLTCGWDT